MRKYICLFLALIMLFSCGCTQSSSQGSESTGPVSVTIWHDKEDSVIDVLTDALAVLEPDIHVVFEKKTGLTESLKLVGNDKNAAPDMYFFAHDKPKRWSSSLIVPPTAQSEL